MTIRAILLGLFGAVVVCGYGYFNDAVMRQTPFVGNFMPVAVYGGLILFVMLVNPLLARIRAGWMLGSRELVVILALTLAACCIPGSSLMRTLTTTLALPHHYNTVQPGWRSHRVLETVPRKMLTDVNDANEHEVLGGFINGMPRPADQTHIGLSDVPWSAWTRTMGFWLPLVLALSFSLIGLALVVHRQWAKHEQLPYPVAEVANTLLPAPGRTWPDVFRNPLFWVAAVAVGVLHLNNFAATLWPEHVVHIPRTFDASPLLELMPTVAAAPSGLNDLMQPTVFFTVVAFAYFLATDVSLSLGIGPYLLAYIRGLLTRYGVPYATGGLLHPGPQMFHTFGAYFGSFMGLLVLGRRYYAAVFRRALGLSSGDSVDVSAIWGARVFAVSVAVFMIMLHSLGVDWPITLIYTALTVMTFLVMGRIFAETGVFFFQPVWYACAILVGVLGIRALDPQTHLILMLLTLVLAHNPRETLMPFVVNALKLLDARRVPLGRTSVWCGAALVLGILVAVPVTLYLQYDQGMNRDDSWAVDYIPTVAFNEAIRDMQRLIAQDRLEEAESISGPRRFATMSPNGPCLIGFGIGFTAVWLFTLLRLRFSWWPLHPVMFLVWIAYPARAMAFSFLIGWLIKVIVMRYGGPATYQRLKPMMIGLIAGDMLGGVIPMLIGVIHYYITGNSPPPFMTMPG
jgi:hypothetical protein